MANKNIRKETKKKKKSDISSTAKSSFSSVVSQPELIKRTIKQK